MNSSVKYDGLFHISDWFPTILKLAQLAPSDKVKELDGVDHAGKAVCLYAILEIRGNPTQCDNIVGLGADL